MSQTNTWSGRRYARIKEFTNAELEDTISRHKARISQLEQKNDPILNYPVMLLSNELAHLVAERAERIGKQK
jgi:hypothetical protein